MAELHEILEGYFIDLPEESPYTDYDPQKQEMTAGVIGFGDYAPDYTFVSAEAVTENRIRVHLLGHVDKINMDYYWDSYIIAEVIDGEAKMCSCHSEDRK